MKKIIRKYGGLFVRNVFYFSKKVRLFSQNDVLLLFYFLINPAGTTVEPSEGNCLWEEWYLCFYLCLVCCLITQIVDIGSV